MANAPRPTSHPSTSRSADQLAVDRAIAELRGGGTVAVRAGENHDRIALVSAAEMATDGTLPRLAALAGSEPSLVLTRNRAIALGLRTENADEARSSDQPVVSIALPSTTPSERVLAIADPTADPTGEAPELLSKTFASFSETEGSGGDVAVKLAKLARLLPSVLVASVPGVDGRSLPQWAHDRALLSVDRHAIERYKAEASIRLTRAASAQVPLADAEDCELIAFRPLDGGTEHVAIKIGDPEPDQPILIRLHSQCLTGDLLGSLRCDCGDQLRGAIREIAAGGGGYILYLAQEGRDIGLINKLKAYRLQDLGADTVGANIALGFDDDERVYFPAAEMLRQLGVGAVRLLTNNPSKIEALRECGVEVIERVPHAFPSNQHNERYLVTKAARSGHLLGT